MKKDPQVDNSLDHSLKEQKKQVRKRKILTYVNTVLIIMVCFGGFYLYRSQTEPQNDPEVAISQLKKQLPVKFDEQTTFKSLDENLDEIVMTIEKSAEAFENLTADQKEEALTAYLNQSKNLCSIAILHQIIENGKNIRVVLTYRDKRKEQLLTVETCSESK